MKILQVTNIVSHHQLPVARQILQSLGEENFRFAATQKQLEERKNMGWNMEEKESWILNAGESDSDRQSFEEWWDGADVVITGEFLPEMIDRRLRNQKLTFYMSERWWKEPIGKWRLLSPKHLLRSKKIRALSNSNYFHYLAIGGLAHSDMKLIAPFPGRMWRWGYFTALPEIREELSRDADPIKIMWAGRMLDWKRVDTLIDATSKLQQDYPNIFLTIIGMGSEKEKLEKLASEKMDKEKFEFLPPQPVSEIMEFMKQHHIYVLPSTGCEGWGAVVNEALALGCAVVASEKAGSSASLIQHRENGMLFAPGDSKQLHAQLLELCKQPQLMKELSHNGQETIWEVWSPEIASARLISTCRSLLSGGSSDKYSKGPMSQLGNY